MVYSGFVHQWNREPEIVHERAERVIALSNEHGFVRWLQAGLILQGWALAVQGQAEAGMAQISQSLTMFQSMGWNVGMPHVLAILAEAHHHGGQLQVGLQVLDEALSIVQHTQECCYEAELHRLRGELLRDQYGDDLERAYQEAEICFQQALEIARRQLANSLELRAAMSLGRLWHQQGKQTEAHRLLKTLYDGFEAETGSPDLLEAKALIDMLA